jgi:threonine dehydratase
MAEAPGGLWRHAHLFGDDGAPAARAAAEGWTLGEGETPLQESAELARRASVGRLLLKREDHNPSGSHKDRGVLYQVVRHRGEAPGTLVISSSGNAAIAASAACRLTGDRLVAFVSPTTGGRKRERLLSTGAVVVETLKPINFGRYAARVFGLPDLRGTKDPIASIGYRSLAAEIAAELPEVDAVFTFNSSGISMEGMADGFDALAPSPALWSIQSGECVGIVRAIDPEVRSDPQSPAGRLGIRNPPGAAALASRLLASGGGARAVDGSLVVSWTDVLSSHGALVSPEGAAVLAGVATTPGLEGKTVVAVMTGATGGPAPRRAAAEPVRLGSYLEVRRFFVEELGLEPA